MIRLERKSFYGIAISVNCMVSGRPAWTCQKGPRVDDSDQ